MASSEALVKYYDCLKNSFNKIQDKDNKAALINAALRPKLREEFSKSHEVLDSYLEYIKIFSLIYSDQFSNICSQVLAPLWKDIDTAPIKKELPDPLEQQANVSEKLHQTISSILTSRPVLMNEFVHSVVKIFPNPQELRDDPPESFIRFIKNSLRACTYLTGGPLLAVISRILDRVNSMGDGQNSESEGADTAATLVEQAHKIIYAFLLDLDASQLDKIAQSLINAFTSEFLGTKNGPFIYYLLLYTCSFNTKFSDLFIDSLWKIFNDSGKSYKERKASLVMVSSFIARANFVDLDKTISFLTSASEWCHKYLDDHEKDVLNESIDLNKNEGLNLFIALCHSILYLITQRYREMYEQDTLSKIADMNFDRLLDNPIRPLESCDVQTRDRFQEIAILYNIQYSNPITNENVRKKLKSDSTPRKSSKWKVPFEESSSNLVPSHLQPHYRTYYNHRNFTVYRE